jgi:hypothetical protein
MGTSLKTFWRKQMTRKIILAIALVALMAAPAFAAVQNVKVSGDIDSTFVHRADFDFGAGADESERQSVFITQTRLRVDADLSDNVSATIALINERSWGDTDGEAGEDAGGSSVDRGINDVDLTLA